MRERRFHVPDLSHSPIRLEAEELHHLVHVLRLRVGDAIALFDGRGKSCSGTILRLGAKSADIEVGDALPSRESKLALRLAVSVPKGDRMSWIVQKATELGVVELVPLTSARSAPRVSARLERWRRVALEACKQSGRSLVPSVVRPTDLATLLKSREASAPLWIAHPSGPPLPPAAGTDGDVEEATLCIGPEGGFSEQEISLGRERGASIFGLGPRTLRTETAAITAVALFQWLRGDLQ